MENEVACAQAPTGRKRNTEHLMKQDLATLDVAKLTPLTPEVISRQATINLGTIGHVEHGKSTVVQALSNTTTVRFKNELERNITIKLGYANAKIYQCTNPDCPRPACFASHGSLTEDTPLCERPGCGARMKLVRHVSFVDCPGHDILMATMLTGAAIMDAALLLIAANEPCPRPQTSEHLAAVEIMNLKNIIILQNKIDLITEEQAREHYKTILKFIQGTVAEGSPIVPISAQFRYNMDVVCEMIVNHVPIPMHDYTVAPRMTIIRSFDVNKPGCTVEDLVGGVAGGTIIHGVLKIGDEIEIRPGITTRDDKTGEIRCKPLRSRVISLFAEENDLQYAVPGGLIGVGTMIDPMVCRSDRLIGQVLGAAGKLPDIFTELEVNFFLLKRLLGVVGSSDVNVKVSRLAKGEVVLVNVGATSTGAHVAAVKGDLAKIVLVRPVCTCEGEKFALSRRIDKHWRLIGWGSILRGVKLEI